MWLARTTVEGTWGPSAPAGGAAAFQVAGAVPSVALASDAAEPGISSWCASEPLDVTSTVRAIARSVIASSGVSASDRLRNTPAGVSRQLAEGLASMSAPIWSCTSWR